MKIKNSVFQIAFKSTLIFLLVRCFQVFAGLIKNKIGAIFLGAFGMGLYGIYMNVINLIQKIASLGISEVAMRDISEISQTNDKNEINIIISIVKKITFITALLGSVLIILFSPLISMLNFGDFEYITKIIFLSPVVYFGILNEGNLAILKGLRKINELVLVNFFIAIFGIILVFPLYYKFGVNGIIPLLFCISFFSYIVSAYYSKKYLPIKINIDLLKFKGRIFSMIKIGLAVVFASFLGFFFELVIFGFLNQNSGTEAAGSYFAGYTIIFAYFGLILNSIVVDYFPRISSKIDDLGYVINELNEQSKIGLIIILPLSLILAYFSDFIVSLLFSIEFVEASNFIDYAIMGSIFIVLSNNLGMIIIAKKLSKPYTLITLIHRLLLLILYIVLFNSFGFTGLGIGYCLNGLLQFLFYEFFLFKYHDIRHDKYNYLLLLFTIISTVFVLILKNNILFNENYSNIVFALFFTMCSFISLKKIQDNRGFQFLEKLYKK